MSREHRSEAADGARRFGGLWPVMLTPFRADGAIDWRGGRQASQVLEWSGSIGAGQSWTILDTVAPPTPISNSYTHDGAPAGYYRIRAERE